MNIDVVAAQLRIYATIFNGNVAGAAAYANSVADQVWLPLPAAYVVPLEHDAGENESQGGSYQIIRERVGIIVVISTPNAGGSLDLADRRGQAAAGQIDECRASIFRAIYNWRPDWNPLDPTTNKESRGIYFVNGNMESFDRARMFYQFAFGLDTLVTDADGWQLPFDPLVDVSGTVVDQINQSETIATFDVPLQGST